MENPAWNSHISIVYAYIIQDLCSYDFIPCRMSYMQILYHGLSLVGMTLFKVNKVNTVCVVRFSRTAECPWHWRRFIRARRSRFARRPRPSSATPGDVITSQKETKRWRNGVLLSPASVLSNIFVFCTVWEASFRTIIKCHAAIWMEYSTPSCQKFEEGAEVNESASHTFFTTFGCSATQARSC